MPPVPATYVMTVDRPKRRPTIVNVRRGNSGSAGGHAHHGLVRPAEGKWSARWVVTMPPGARGRKSRLLRADEPPNDLLVVIRATPANRELAIDEMVEDAELSSRQYVVEAIPGGRELLYGVAVLARRQGVDVGAVIDRFVGAPAYIEATIGSLRAAGFVVLPTGANFDHFDIQLVSGIREQDAPAATDILRHLATRVLSAGGPFRPNPAYSGGAAEFSQEDR